MDLDKVFDRQAGYQPQTHNLLCIEERGIFLCKKTAQVFGLPFMGIHLSAIGWF